MKIVVLDGYTLDPGDNPWTGLDELGEVVKYERTPREKLVERAASADILLTNKTPISAETLTALPFLKFISVLATGYNVVDTAAARERGIPVSNVPAYGTNTVAQYVMALLLELCHGVGAHAASVANGEWAKSADWSYWKSAQVELDGLTMGIVGYGRIGQRVAELARAFGMRVLYASRSSPEGPENVSVETLFRDSDVISLHCTLGPENAGFVNAALLRTMKPSAFLINTARGALVNEADLAMALREGWLAGAAVDVLSSEPPAAENPLTSAPRCLVTPHIAWASLAARRRIVKATEENVRAFVKGAPINVVNGVRGGEV